MDNARKVCQGQLGGELTETGWEQAAKIGMRLKSMRTAKFDLVTVSDLNRTR